MGKPLRSAPDPGSLRETGGGGAGAGSRAVELTSSVRRRFPINHQAIAKAIGMPIPSSGPQLFRQIQLVGRVLEIGEIGGAQRGSVTGEGDQEITLATLLDVVVPDHN